MSSDEGDFAIVICRACLNECIEFQSIHRKKRIRNEVTTLAEMLTCCTLLEYPENEDSMPVHLCNNCVKKLFKLNDFRQMVLKSEEILRQHYANSNINKFEEPSEQENGYEIENEPEEAEDSKAEVEEITLEYEDINATDYEEIFLEELPSSTETEDNTSASDQIYNPDLQCQTCGKQLKTAATLRCHMKLHSEGTPAYTCEVCGQSYHLQCSLLQHVLKHNPEKPFHCEICGKGDTRKCDHEKHMRTHTGEKPYTCDICSRGFTCSSALFSHRRHHTGEKPHNCSLCDKRFRTSSQLKRHTLVHTGARPHRCDICGVTFKRKNFLALHREKNHADDLDASDLGN